MIIILERFWKFCEKLKIWKISRNWAMNAFLRMISSNYSFKGCFEHSRMRGGSVLEHFAGKQGWQFTRRAQYWYFSRAKKINRWAKIYEVRLRICSNLAYDALIKMKNVWGWSDVINLKINWSQILYRGSKNDEKCKILKIYFK